MQRNVHEQPSLIEKRSDTENERADELAREGMAPFKKNGAAKD